MIKIVGIKDYFGTSCYCREGQLYPDGSMPEYVKTIEDAARSFYKGLIGGRLYWGVHLGGDHILNVIIDGNSLKHVGKDCFWK